MLPMAYMSEGQQNIGVVLRGRGELTELVMPAQPNPEPGESRQRPVE